jgi:hypothetical protein
MLDNLLLIYGLKEFDKRFLNRIFSMLTIFSICFTIIKVILIIRIEDNLNIILIKLMLLLIYISSLMSYTFIAIRSQQLSELRIHLKSYRIKSTPNSFSTFFSTSFAIIVMISTIVLTFLFRNNYHHMKKLFEEPIEHFKYKRFLQLNTDFGLILNCIFNYGWKIILQLIHYNIKRQYLSILIMFNNQLKRRLNIPSVGVIDSTHRTVNEFLYIKISINNNMGLIKYFIKLDITLFLIFYILLLIDSLSQLNIYSLLTLFGLIVMFYSYYYFLQSISSKVQNNENLIKFYIDKWDDVLTDTLSKIHFNALKRTSDEFVNFSVLNV